MLLKAIQQLEIGLHQKFDSVDLLVVLTESGLLQVVLDQEIEQLVDLRAVLVNDIFREALDIADPVLSKPRLYSLRELLQLSSVELVLDLNLRDFMAL